MTRRRPVAGSHPEEGYLPATRQRMFLDRPTSHGGWPEGEYDPPVRDRIYGWYKKMGMMPEEDAVTEAVDEYLQEKGLDMKIREGRHQNVVGYGRSIGFEYGAGADEAERIAMNMLSGDPDLEDAAMAELRQNPHLARNVQSLVRSEGEYDLAKAIGSMIRPAGDAGLRSMIRATLREAAFGDDYFDTDDGEYTYRLFRGGDIQIIRSKKPSVSAQNPIKVKKSSKYYPGISKFIRGENPSLYDEYFSSSPAGTSDREEVSDDVYDESNVCFLADFTDTEWFTPLISKNDISFPFKKQTDLLDARKPVKILRTGSSGCAAWVGEILDKSIGNAWQAYNQERGIIAGKQKFSAFDMIDDYEIDEMVDLFSRMNASGNFASFNDEVSRFVERFVPDQRSLASMLEIGDVVGMYHKASSFHGKAFFQSMTGREGDFALYKAAISDEKGRLWDPSMFRSIINFEASSFLRNRKVIPTPNTHAGIVGAKVDGVPVIFHFVGDTAAGGEGNVYASHINMMRPERGNDAIVWIASSSDSGESKKKEEPKEKSFSERASDKLTDFKRFIGYDT